VSDFIVTGLNDENHFLDLIVSFIGDRLISVA